MCCYEIALLPEISQVNEGDWRLVNQKSRNTDPFRCFYAIFFEWRSLRHTACQAAPAEGARCGTTMLDDVAGAGAA